MFTELFIRKSMKIIKFHSLNLNLKATNSLNHWNREKNTIYLLKLFDYYECVFIISINTYRDIPYDENENFLFTSNKIKVI